VDSLVLTYQGQLLQHKLEFQANQVISVGVAASAMPSAEAEAVGAVDSAEDPAQLSSSSSKTASASDAASTSSALEAQHGAMQISSGAARGEDSSVSSVASASEGDLTDDSSSWPDYERFKLLIRSINAEVEF
jgi:hypothetical protein